MSIVSGMFNFWRTEVGVLGAIPNRDRYIEDIFCAEGALHRRANDRSYRFRLVPRGPDFGSGRNESDCAIQVRKHDY